MNKKILTAAIGAAMVAGPLAAQADLKISGRVAGELVNGGDVTKFQDNGNTRLQFDIKDDSGFYARAAIDLRASKALPHRDQYVGYKAGFGTVQAGRMAGAVKNLEKDPFIGTFLELRNNAVLGSQIGDPLKGVGSSSFVNNMLQVAGKSGDVGYKLQYSPVSPENVGSGQLQGDMGIAVTAKMAGASVYLGYNNMGNITGANASNTKLGGAMKFGDINAKLTYETLAVAGLTNSSLTVGAEMSLGDGASVDVTYGDRGGQGADAYTRVGYMKKASKKARWWVGYVNNGNATADATFGGGVRVDI